MKQAWITEHRDSFDTIMTCEVLGVSRSGYYESVGRPKSVRQQRIENPEVSVARSRPQRGPTDRSGGLPTRWTDASRRKAPDRKWVTDITYLETAVGWVYLAVELNFLGRKVVGWSVADPRCRRVSRRELCPDAGGGSAASCRGMQWGTRKYFDMSRVTEEDAQNSRIRRLRSGTPTVLSRLS